MRKANRNSFAVRVLLSGFTGCLLAGCAMVPGVANLSARSAENPIKGQAVTWNKEAEGLPFEGQKACTTWPIEDSLSVKATDAEICVDGQVYSLVAAGFDGPSEASLDVESDGSGESGLGSGHAGDLKSRPQKVGTCTDSVGSKTVWVAKYTGCVPNKTMSGKPALSAQSTYLQVGKARWKFPAPAPAAAPAPPANSSAKS